MDDAQEALRFEAVSTYQYTVDIRLAHQIIYILWLDATAVKNANLFRRFTAEPVRQPLSDGLVHFLSHLGRRRTAGTYCPNRFVGENDTQEVVVCQAIQTAFKLLAEDGLISSTLTEPLR